MSGPLRVAMIGIVLVNLAFVQLTEAASWTWRSTIPIEVTKSG